MIWMHCSDLVKRMRRALYAEAAFKAPVAVEVQAKHPSAEDHWVAQWGSGNVLYDIWLRVEVQPGAQPCDEVWMFVGQPVKGGGGTPSLTWRGCVNRIELVRVLRQHLPGITAKELMARIAGLRSVVHADYVEPSRDISGSRPTGPAE